MKKEIKNISEENNRDVTSWILSGWKKRLTKIAISLLLVDTSICLIYFIGYRLLEIDGAIGFAYLLGLALPFSLFFFFIAFLYLFFRSKGKKKYIFFFLALIFLYGFYSLMILLAGKPTLEEYLANKLESDFFCKILVLNSESQKSCYIKLAIENNDINICEKLDEYEKYNCYHELAKRNRDVTLCDQIKKWFKNECYKDLAKILEDESLCEKLEENQGTNSKSYCFYDLAKIKNDISLCDKISDDFTISPYVGLARRCYQYFNQ